MGQSEAVIRRALDVLVTAGLFDGEAPMARKRFRETLSSPGVVGIGIAEREGPEDLALTVYVESADGPLIQSDGVLLPDSFPDSLLDSASVPVQIKEIGKLTFEANAARNPLQPGNSLGILGAPAGTLGAVVVADGAPMLLSNAHVLANCGKAPFGERILVPSPNGDGGADPDDVVAGLVRSVPLLANAGFVNYVDAAVGGVRPSVLHRLSAEVRTLHRRPEGSIAPARGMLVEKVGRTTDRTAGKVVDADFHCAVDYPGFGRVGFRNQVLCTRFTEGGDSGSLIFQQGTALATGLHVGGAKGGSFFSPIATVLSLLHISFA